VHERTYSRLCEQLAVREKDESRWLDDAVASGETSIEQVVVEGLIRERRRRESA
jgi:hypothetical protein